MKLLFENWRKYLLIEAAMTVDDLMNFVDEEFGEDLKIYIRVRNNNEGGTDITYASIDVDGEIYDFGYNDAVMGKVEIVPASYGEEEGLGPCDGAYQVKWAMATEGWGPLLYDAAIEYATKHGNGLISDREMISDEARAVWDYYLNKRKDVDNHQLDDLHNTLTPKIEVDNCDQYVASVGGKYDWEENSLSKRYTKAPTTITELEKIGRFIDET
mgnify:FL=1